MSRVVFKDQWTGQGIVTKIFHMPEEGNMLEIIKALINALERSDDLTTQIDELQQQMNELNKKRVLTSETVGMILGVDADQVNYEQLRKVIGM